ncbi:MAG: response regulator, partial [Deltaproteobacteria bacterium]|nr:response regulator [Deltaproteobacteria bacterium]
MSPEIKPLLILVEDDDDDALLVQEAIEELKLPIQLKRVKDATQLFDFLYQDPLKPSLVLLDLNLPQMNGKEILSHMKQHEASRSIPIVIYTTSQNPDDIRQCYQLGANAFIR